MDDEGVRAVGISLWLVPEGEAAAVLAGIIADLAARLGGPPFRPHVTLLGGLRTREGDTVRKAKEMAATLEPFSLPVGPVEGREDYFRALFVRIPETLRLLTTHAQARITYGIADEARYEPHLSLVYGQIPADERARLADEVGGKLPPRLSFSALEVVRTDGPVGGWQRLDRITLG